jgi:hypothetical protein
MSSVFCLLVRKQKMYKDQLMMVLDTFLYIHVVIYKKAPAGRRGGLELT